MTAPDLDLAALGHRLRTGTLTARALVEDCLDRIAADDPHVHAFVKVMPDSARADADRADADFAQGRDNGPLQGIPVALKDLIDIAGEVTGCGAHAPRDPATQDAGLVTRLRDSGAVIIGKVATYPFGLVGPDLDGPAPPALNPRDPARITGGSSSGSAAAVAAGLVPVSIGTDTGGSLRSPASYCGVVGLKPTRGLVSMQGIFPVAPGLDHAGPIATSVTNAALALDAIADPAVYPNRIPAAASLGQGIEGLRIAYARNWFAGDPACDADLLRCLDDAVSRLSLLGARIAPVTLPDYPPIEIAGATILRAEALAQHATDLRVRPGIYSDAARRSLTDAGEIPAADLAQARERASDLAQHLETAIFLRHHALVTATTLTPAPPLDDFRRGDPVWTPMRTLPFNMTGHPSLSVSAGLAHGLPVGLQIVGPYLAEAQICRIGAAFERDRPPLYP